MTCAQTALLRALARRAGPGHTLTLRTARSRPWASATFTGARHSFALLLSGPDAAEQASRLGEEVSEVEFTLPGHLVADIAIVRRNDEADGAAIEIEALTIEDR
jgi:hypothetical protein